MACRNRHTRRAALADGGGGPLLFVLARQLRGVAGLRKVANAKLEPDALLEGVGVADPAVMAGRIIADDARVMSF